MKKEKDDETDDDEETKKKKLTGKPRNRSQQKRHIPTDRLIRTSIRRFRIRSRDRSSQQRIAQHPRQKNTAEKKKGTSTSPSKKPKKNALGPKSPIIVLLLRPFIGLTIHLGWLRVQHVYRIFIQRIDILLICRYFRFHFPLFARFTGGHGAEVFGDGVVTFSTPRDVVDVCKLLEDENG